MRSGKAGTPSERLQGDVVTIRKTVFGFDEGGRSGDSGFVMEKQLQAVQAARGPYTTLWSTFAVFLEKTAWEGLRPGSGSSE